MTCFEFRLHPVGPQVLAILVVHPYENAGELLRRYASLRLRRPRISFCGSCCVQQLVKLVHAFILMIGQSGSAARLASQTGRRSPVDK